jgi:hypothetical protein
MLLVLTIALFIATCVTWGIAAWVTLQDEDTSRPHVHDEARERRRAA